MEMVDAHVASGGHLSIFPEGDLNTEWQQLLQFRAGGIEPCIRHDMEVWGWINTGTAECWPHTAPLGGAPSVLRARAFLLHRSAKEAAQKLGGADSDLRVQAVALADDMRSRMQQVLTDMLRESAVGDSV
eukprot:CAMPEP_0171097320 /NCGR_PEP_ID=MMETSP0766_2-20121228/47478_1 /TAXON_ID=439317 /ORGANISM="Gambierdiscus australes, Strain CAWD 149" /LENGTH=129 /DNA_ID=CAMNT_0011556499 /DNA_START=658 /DNA_END=1047 /DNA_ORIENTATION=+